MADVIEFPKPQLEQPDADCMTIVVTDGKPVKWFKFGIEFEGPDGKQYGFHIWATDWADAEARMACIRVSGRVEGQLFAEIPA